MKRLVILLALLMAAAAAPAAAQSGGLATFETAGLSIETAAGERHDFEVEIAETPAQRSQARIFPPQMRPTPASLFLSGGRRCAGCGLRTTFFRLVCLFITKRGRYCRLGRDNAGLHPLMRIRNP